MIKSRLFKLPEHKRFSFPARYYNEDKERLEQRIKDIKTGNYKYNIKDSFKRNNTHKTWNKNWNTIRLLIIFGILIFGMVFLYNQIDLVVDSLNKK